MIKKFVLEKSSTDTAKIERLEKYALSNGAIVKPNAAKLLVLYWKKRWAQCSRNWSTIENRYKSWLDQDVYTVPNITRHSQSEPRGRKRTRFQDLSDSQKRRRTAGNVLTNIFCSQHKVSYAGSLVEFRFAYRRK